MTSRYHPYPKQKTIISKTIISKISNSKINNYLSTLFNIDKTNGFYKKRFDIYYNLFFRFLDEQDYYKSNSVILRNLNNYDEFNNNKPSDISRILNYNLKNLLLICFNIHNL